LLLGVVLTLCGLMIEWASDVKEAQRTEAVARSVCGEGVPYKWEDTPQGGALLCYDTEWREVKWKAERCAEVSAP
jgi:hypothetical protein